MKIKGNMITRNKILQNTNKNITRANSLALFLLLIYQVVEGVSEDVYIRQ